VLISVAPAQQTIEQVLRPEQGVPVNLPAAVTRPNQSPHRQGLARARLSPPILGSGALREHGMMVLIVLCFAIAATIHTCTATIWYDEALTLLTVSGHAQTALQAGMEEFQPSADLRKIVVDLYTQDVHPPLYFWTLALWRVAVGESLEAARTLSAIFVMGTLLLLYRYARRLGIERPWIPVAVFAVSGPGLQYTYNARPYAMAAFLVVLTLVLVQRESRWTGLSAATAVATHYFAALCVVPMLAVGIARNWTSRRNWAWFTAISFGMGAAPLLALLRVHFTARPHQYPGFGPANREILALLEGAIESGLPHSWLGGWRFALLAAGAVACVGIWRCYKERKLAVPFAYAGFVLGFLLLAAVTNKSIAKMPGDYYLGIGAPLSALLIGCGLGRFPGLSPVLAMLITIGMATANPLINSTNYRAIAKKVRADCPGCTIVVGKGYAGAVPACVLYETKGMKVLTMNSGETPEDVLARTGDREPLLLVKTNEPPTVRSEDQFVKSYPAVWKGGYFEIYPHAAPRPGSGADETETLASRHVER